MRRLVTDDGTERIDFASASYLGLSFDRRLAEVLHQSVDGCGLYSYCSPIFLRPPAQIEVERILSDLTGYEDCVLFQSATSLHCGVLPVLASHKRPVFIDEHTHQSIFDALRIAGNRRVYRFEHNSVESAGRLIARECVDTDSPILATDGVFSMSGEIAPIEQLGRVAAEARGLLYVDDSHGFGVLGQKGEGLASVVSCLPCDTMYVGTMSKALAVPLAFIAMGRERGSAIRTSAHTCVFSGNVPVAMMDVALAALSISASTEGTALRSALVARVQRMVTGLLNVGVVAVHSGGGIVAFDVDGGQEFERVCVGLDEEGIAFNPVMFPAIPKGRFRVRFCISSEHTLADIDQAIMAVRNCYRPTGSGSQL